MWTPPDKIYIMTLTCMTGAQFVGDPSPHPTTQSGISLEQNYSVAYSLQCIEMGKRYMMYRIERTQMG